MASRQPIKYANIRKLLGTRSLHHVPCVGVFSYVVCVSISKLDRIWDLNVCKKQYWYLNMQVWGLHC